MNILECYLKKIYSETPIVHLITHQIIMPDGAIRSTWEEKEDWLEVEWEYDCYGSLTRVKEPMTVKRWQEIKDKGYDMR